MKLNTFVRIQTGTLRAEREQSALGGGARARRRPRGGAGTQKQEVTPGPSPATPAQGAWGMFLLQTPRGARPPNRCRLDVCPSREEDRGHAVGDSVTWPLISARSSEAVLSLLLVDSLHVPQENRERRGERETAPRERCPGRPVPCAGRGSSPHTPRVARRKEQSAPWTPSSGRGPAPTPGS